MEEMLLPLKRYADFSGRSRRREFWMFYLAVILALVAVAIISAILSVISSTLAGLVAGLGYAVVGLGSIIPLLATQVRRYHDQDKPGWFLIPGLIIPFWAIIFMCIEGTRGPNQYGPDPKGPGADTFS
jgi:uncharacterized membrane protein YhaH (DUF805 family)